MNETNMTNNKEVETVEVSADFIEAVYELAFGDNAINRDFSEAEVIEMLKEMSDAFAVLQD